MSTVPAPPPARPLPLLPLLLLLACGCLLLAGFSDPRARGLADPAPVLAARLAAPGGVSPLLPRARVQALLATLPARSGQVTTPDGVPVYWQALDPGDYQLRYAYRGVPGDEDSRMRYALSASAPAGAPPPPRGTVVLLHGWMMDGGSLLPWSLALAGHGYRTIAIDLRNHGRSGAAPSGYGTREAGDVAAVLRQLRTEGEVAGPLHLLGVSYGAATAIFTARQMGDEVAGVVAMESFANAGDAIRDMVPHMLSRPAPGVLAEASRQWLRWRVDPAMVDAAISDAGHRLALDLDQVDVGAALAQASPCVLLLHGSEDAHVPVAHGRRLAAASPQARYLELAGEDHLSLPMRLDRLQPTVTDWFDRTGDPGGACPRPLPPG